MQISEEIKSRLDIVDVIKEYVQLKPVGSNFSALSPFNREKTPSFMVSPEKQIWHCFSSGKGGDIITFVMEIEGVSFVEALRILAPKAGVTLKREDPKVTSKRNKLLDIQELAANYYHRVLMESEAAKSARDYLSRRDLKEETLIDWKLGFSPASWDDLLNLLRKKGYKDEEIISAGLANKKAETGRVYNRFRERIMFPLSDYNGNIVAFSSRVLPEKEKEEIMGKYVNSPQTMIYDKSRVLFGLDKAKSSIKEEDCAVVVEGQMDVITAHQNGFSNVIASSGTALTREQLKLVKRYSSNLILAFDMDQAGQMAVDRGIREAMPLDVKLKIVDLGEDKDPDELIRKDPEKWKEKLASARHIMDYYFDKALKNLNPEELEGKREVARQLLPVINRISDLIEKDYWLKKLSQKLDVEEGLLREALSKTTQPQKNYSDDKEETQTPQTGRPSSREEIVSQNLLALLLRFPQFAEYVLNRIGIEQVHGEINKQIYRNLIIYYNNNESDSGESSFSVDYAGFREFLKNRVLDQKRRENQSLEENSDSSLKLLDKLAVLGEKDYYNLEERQVKNEIIKIINLLRKGSVRERMREIEKTIREAETEEEGSQVEDLMRELKSLSEELQELEKQEYY